MNTSVAERTELHKTIWRIANDLRGSVDGLDCNNDVLGKDINRVSWKTLVVASAKHKVES